MLIFFQDGKTVRRTMCRDYATATNIAIAVSKENNGCAWIKDKGQTVARYLKGERIS